MKKVIPIIIVGSVLAISCSQGPRMEWKRVPMDGSRTGVVAVNAENVDTALGAFEDDYIAPNGRHFTDGATPEVAAMLMEVQPKMAHLKKVVGHNARFMDNPRTECDLPIGNLVADALRAKAADYFQVPVEFALTNYGGIRIPMPEGAVTLDDIESMFPFKNYMCLAKLRGSELTRLLEQLAKTPAFQAVSGCRVKVTHRPETPVQRGHDRFPPLRRGRHCRRRAGRGCEAHFGADERRDAGFHQRQGSCW